MVMKKLWMAAALVLGVYLGAIPAAAAFYASLSEFDLWGLLVAAARWRREDGRYLPGPGTGVTGYVAVCQTADTADGGGLSTLDPALLWD